MKKQILILIVALFAVTTAFGQTLVPNPIGCAVTEGPLTPQLGKTYTYTVAIPNSAQFTGAVPLKYNWFVTKDKTFITLGALSATVLPSGAANDFVATGTYNSPAGISPTIDISWNTTASLTDPFFLVVNVIGDNTLCTPANTKIYKIIPANLFTLDVANVTSAGVAGALLAPLTTCVADIQSITWVDTDQTHAKYDYGVDYLYFAVAAANFSTSWDATVNITNDQGQALITNVAWSRTYNGTYTDLTAADADTWTANIPASAAAVGGTVGSAGETITIRVTLDYTTATNFFEGILDQAVNFEVDGVTALGDPDLHWDAGVVADCGNADAFKYDKLVHTVKQRPAINSATGTGPEPFLIPIP